MGVEFKASSRTLPHPASPARCYLIVALRSDPFTISLVSVLYVTVYLLMCTCLLSNTTTSLTTFFCFHLLGTSSYFQSLTIIVNFILSHSPFNFPAHSNKLHLHLEPRCLR